MLVVTEIFVNGAQCMSISWKNVPEVSLAFLHLLRKSWFSFNLIEMYLSCCECELHLILHITINCNLKLRSSY